MVLISQDWSKPLQTNVIPDNLGFKWTIYMLNHGSLFCSNIRPTQDDLRQFTSIHFRFTSIYVNPFSIYVKLRSIYVILRSIYVKLRSIYVNFRQFTSKFGKIWLKNVQNDKIHVQKIQGCHFLRKKSPCGAYTTSHRVANNIIIVICVINIIMVVNVIDIYINLYKLTLIA